MRAAAYDDFGGPITVRDLPEPRIGPADALVEVRATGVCRSDWHGWIGHDPDIRSLPHVPGHEFSGTVAAVGEEVTRWGGGEPVVVPFIAGCGRCDDCLAGNAQVCPQQTQPGFTHWGSFAERVLVRNADFNLVGLPTTVDFVTAAVLGCRFTTAYRAVAQRAKTRDGEIIAVYGCGGVGLSAVMIARALGAEVVAIDPNPEALALARVLGASTTLTPVEAADGLPARGPHVTIDAIGDPEVAGSAVASLRPGGRHVQVGLLRADGFSRTPANEVVAKELEIMGSHGMAATDFRGLLDSIVEGTLEPGKLIRATVDLQTGIQVLTQMTDESPVGVTVITEI